MLVKTFKIISIYHVRYLYFSTALSDNNTFPCWLYDWSEENRVYNERYSEHPTDRVEQEQEPQPSSETQPESEPELLFPNPIFFCDSHRDKDI